MVRDASVRMRRYEKGINPDVIGARFGQVKAGMVRLESEYLAQITLVEGEVKRIVEAVGVPTFEVAQYVNVGRQCYSIAKRFSQATRDLEAQRVVNKWASRGLDGPLLVLACRAGGCEVEEPPAACWNPCPHGMDKHTFSLPPVLGAYNVCKLGCAYNRIISGTWVPNAVAEVLYGGLLNTSNALNDEVEYRFVSEAGAFNFVLNASNGPNRGIVTILIDGVSQGTIDMYAGGWGDALNVLPVTITSAGNHTLRIRVTGTNPLSGAYYALIKAFWLRD